MRNKAPSERLVLEHFLPYRLSALTNRISAVIAGQYSRQFDLTPAEWRVMAALGNTPRLSSSEVAARTAMDKVQVSRAVARLVAAGRVSRAADTRDSRVARLRLSASGRAIYRKIVPHALDIEAQLMASLNGAEREQLNRLLTKLDQQIEALTPILLEH
ncbi:MAG: MarR family transcriptional regulator [Rhizomicrobium sp.]|nr:MarR family transcriptional regulator [Rhizomicrobium sp.]